MNGQRGDRSEQPYEGQSESRPRYLSPFRLFVIIALTVFTGEFIVMLVLAMLPEMPTVTEALLDGFMITLIVTPALVLFLIRPMVVHISHREVLEGELRKLNNVLEDRVAERTAELTASVEQFKREVAERKQAEKGLLKSAEFIEAVLRSAPCILAIYDVNSLSCSFVNESVTGFLGYSPDDALVKGEGFFKEIFSPEDFASFRKLNARVASGLEDEILRCECQLRNVEGAPLSFGIGIVSLKDSLTNMPKDVLLAAVPTGSGWPNADAAQSPGQD